MRGPLKYLALLVLVPFLGCTDTPAEPETAATALFKQAQPSEPGWYIHVDVRCRQGWAGWVAATDYDQASPYHAVDACGVPPGGESPWLLLSDLTDPWIERLNLGYESKYGVVDTLYCDAYNIGWLLEEPLAVELPNEAVSWLVELVIVE